MIIYLAADHAGFALKEKLKVSLRGDGYQVLDPKTGIVYQRYLYDLLPLKKNETAEAAA